jgi:hypothetical protein
MPPLRAVALLAVRSGRSRVYWRGIGGGILVALAIQLIFLLAALLMGQSTGPVSIEVPRDGTAHMICANLASLAGAAVSAVLASQAANQYVAFNAYLCWAGASLILMVNVALTTHVVA